jgi:hypothetical protein
MKEKSKRFTLDLLGDSMFLDAYEKYDLVGVLNRMLPYYNLSIIGSFMYIELRIYMHIWYIYTYVYNEVMFLDDYEKHDLGLLHRFLPYYNLGSIG